MKARVNKKEKRVSNCLNTVYRVLSSPDILLHSCYNNTLSQSTCNSCTMVTVKIKGTTCSLYNVYTVVTASHGVTARLWYIREVIPSAGKLYHG